ncbi:pilus assembly protein PilP [Janthinobacterium sp. GW460P]|uniref:pilus assembly protein PilP n=1 Tax=unclassified Janthinobacterium TaxID=2610881 RepID=UPI00111BD1AE|nr:MULTISPECIES: pilus assembly protein PilP [unclassified Janthinobacterium]MCC7704168.1 pilus assembly protein PilP [Janthinobacterium sp. GW460P]MCC7709780.1 pilus assembly protein PilP [Janthinobacterium sp. GW460W]
MLSLKTASLWPLPARLACAALAGMMVAALLHATWLDGLVAAVRLAHSEEARLRADYLASQARAKQLPQWRAEQRQAGAELALLEQQLPDQQAMAALLTDINTAGQSRGLQFSLFKPGAARPQAPYVALPITIQLRGGYHAMGALLADLARLPRIVTVHALALTLGKDRLLTLDAVLQAYRLPEAGELAAPAALPSKGSVPAWRPLAAVAPHPYAAADLADPFNALPPVPTPGQRSAVAGPDPRRVREPLESVALPAITMVGSVQQDGRLSALLLAGQRVYRVAVGQYLGQDHGVVTDISEQAVQYRELLRAADGPWRERRGSLALQVAGAGAKASLPEAAP